MSSNPYGARLFDHHAKLLADSAIAPHVADARGYVSVDQAATVHRMGFSKKLTAPGLLIPVWNTAGEVALHEYRPDNPRLDSKGRPRKYEKPWKSTNVIDVPPPARDHIRDPAVPLWITEGARKADAAVSAGLCCVALLGVYGWRNKETALPDWESIALRDRDVLVCFDNDVMTKTTVRDALQRLTGFLAYRGANVAHVILPGADGKVGLDDYLAAGGTPERLYALAQPAGPGGTLTEQPSLLAGSGTSNGTGTGTGTRRQASDQRKQATGSAGSAGSASVAEGKGDAAVWSGDPTGLLDRVETFIRRYCALPSDAAYVAMTLWAAHTHALDAAESTPRLAFLSPEPSSGKTRALEVLDLLVPRPMHAVNATVAALFRSVASHRPTILFDEIDTIFGPKAKENEELRGLLNAGHRRSGVAYRCVGEGAKQEVVAFPAYAAVALAGLGDIPDTITSRSVVVAMRPRAPGEQVEPFRLRTATPEGHALRDELAAWLASVTGELAAAYPEMPDGVSDRPADVWEPLLAIADTAGGDWPKRAREACQHMVTAGQGREPSLRLRLLADLRTVFGSAERMSTDDILTRLHKMDEAPWADIRGRPLNSRGMARMLRAYEIRSTKVKIDGRAVQGYRREDLHDAWTRYLPPPATEAEPTEPTEPAQQNSSSEAHRQVPFEVPAPFEVPEPPPPAGPAVVAGSPGQCVAPGCDRPPRRACRTCWDHRDWEMAR